MIRSTGLRAPPLRPVAARRRADSSSFSNGTTARPRTAGRCPRGSRRRLDRDCIGGLRRPSSPSACASESGTCPSLSLGPEGRRSASVHRESRPVTPNDPKLRRHSGTLASRGSCFRCGGAGLRTGLHAIASVDRLLTGIEAWLLRMELLGVDRLSARVEGDGVNEPGAALVVRGCDFVEHEALDRC